MKSTFVSLCALAVLTAAITLSAHHSFAATYDESKTIEIDFSEELNAKLSKIEVQDSMGMQMDKGDSQVAADNEKHLSVDLNALGAGTYKVLWTSVASDDGHKLTGTYSFTVQLVSVIRGD